MNPITVARDVANVAPQVVDEVITARDEVKATGEKTYNVWNKTAVLVSAHPKTAMTIAAALVIAAIVFF